MDNPYLYMSLIALMAKIWAAHRLRQNLRVPGAILCFIFLLIAYSLTVLELYSYYVLTTPYLFSLSLLKLYYIMYAAFLTIMPLLLFSIIYQHVPKGLICLAGGAFIIISGMIFHPTYILIGVDRIHYSFTRIEGEYYAVFRLYCFIMLLLTFFGLLFARLSVKKRIAKIKASNLLIGFVPILITLPVVLVLMKKGYEINAVGVIAITLSVLIWVMSENLRMDKLVDLHCFLIPWSKKARLARELTRPIWEVSLESEGIYVLTDKYYKSIVNHAAEIFKNHSEAAKHLNMSVSTYYRHINNSCTYRHLVKKDSHE